MRFLEFQPLSKAGAFAFFSISSLPLRTNWLKVGNHDTSYIKYLFFKKGTAFFKNQNKAKRTAISPRWGNRSIASSDS